jgi:SAM-dependent methyltransferase
VSNRTQNLAPRPPRQPSSRIRRAYFFVRRRSERLIGHILFERRLAVETEQRVLLRTLGLAAPDRVDYLPSDWLAVRRALRALSVRPDDVFIDFGAGKGRVVLMAARYPFKRVIGVEISEELKSIASRNLEKNAGRLRCREIDLVTADAMNYVVPDNVTVAYFYAPFKGDIFAKVLDNLIASVDRSPRPVRIIYTDPWDQDTLMFTGRVRQIRRWTIGPTAIYLLEPRRGERAPSPTSSCSRSGERKKPRKLE